MLRTGRQNMKENGGKIQYMKVPIFYPQYCIFTIHVCTTFWEGGLIGTSEECIYGVIGICASISMHVSGWSSKTHFGLQMGVKVNEKFSN